MDECVDQVNDLLSGYIQKNFTIVRTLIRIVKSRATYT